MSQRQSVFNLNNNTSDTTYTSGRHFSLLGYGFDTSTMIAAFAVLLISSTVFSYLFKSWTVRAARKNGEPPLVPYTIPWLGHGLSFMWNINLFVKWVRAQNTAATVATVQVAGRHLYIVFDTKLASQIYRRSSTFVFDPFPIMISRALGSTKEDVKIISRGAKVVNKNKDDAENDSKLILDLHNLAIKQLTGEPLQIMTRKFIEGLSARIDARFPVEEGSSYEWEELELTEFVKVLWTEAAVPALFGTKITEQWPGFVEWFWKFDKNIQKFVAELPHFIFSKAYAIKQEGIDHFIKWDEQAWEHSAESGGDPDWDEYWGLRFCRMRAKYFVDAGLSKRGRAVQNVALLWGQNANAIPVAMWAMIQAALDPNLMKNLTTEISKCQTSSNSFDIIKVATNPRIKSVLLETLRWSTASPSPRVVSETTQLGGYTLYKNSLVMVHSRTLQMDPSIWDTSGQKPPEEFWAERFLDGDEEAEKNRLDEARESARNYSGKAGEEFPIVPTIEPLSGPKDKEVQQRMLALRPFGGGQTLCSGRHFATNEILGGLATVLMRLEIQPVEEELKKRGRPEVNLWKQGGLLPDRKMIVRIRRRRV